MLHVARKERCRERADSNPEQQQAKEAHLIAILQVAWHPDSDCHLAVLTSDATWRLYNMQRPDLAEQTFELQLRGR